MSKGQLETITKDDVGTIDAAMLTPKKRVRNSVDTFLRAHEASNSYEELASSLGITVTSAQSRTYTYVKRGYDLKTYPRRKGGGGSKLDVAGGNDFLAKLRAGKNSVD